MEKRAVIDENTPLPEVKPCVKGQRMKMGTDWVKAAEPIATQEDHISKRLADKVKEKTNE